MQWPLKRTFTMDTLLNLSLNRLKIFWDDYLKQSWLTEAARDRKSILGVNIKIPGSGKGKTAYQKRKERERFRRRASIEPIIGHLKQDHRMLRNYLRGVEGDMINTLLAGASFNMMKMLRKIRESIICVLNELIEKLIRNYQVLTNYC